MYSANTSLAALLTRSELAHCQKLSRLCSSGLP
jgi:hypothetical protein